MYDIRHFTAIINPPQAAILAIGGNRQWLSADHLLNEST
jgi:pyruvate/2-oxoglutarate dehydrogenase complex dihydrolipoamide acyltransferase (E2) component